MDERNKAKVAGEQGYEQMLVKSPAHVGTVGVHFTVL